jgi:GTPase KRas protein
LKVNFLFKKEHDSTRDSYSKQTIVDDKLVYVEVMEINGEEKSYLGDTYMKSCNAFIIVYSITSKKSFDEVVDFYEQILRVI